MAIIFMANAKVIMPTTPKVIHGRRRADPLPAGERCSAARLKTAFGDVGISQWR